MSCSCPLIKTMGPQEGKLQHGCVLSSAFNKRTVCAMHEKPHANKKIPQPGKRGKN